MKSKRYWYFLNESLGVIKADYPMGGQMKDSTEHWGKLSHPNSQPTGPEQVRGVGKQMSVITGRGFCDYPYGTSLSDGLMLANI